MDEKQQQEAFKLFSSLGVAARKKKHRGSLSKINRKAAKVRWDRYRASKKLSTDEPSGN